MARFQGVPSGNVLEKNNDRPYLRFLLVDGEVPPDRGEKVGVGNGGVLENDDDDGDK